MTRVGGKGDSKNNTESIETDNETDKHNDDEVGSSNLKEILRDNIRNSLGMYICIYMYLSLCNPNQHAYIHTHLFISFRWELEYK